MHESQGARRRERQRERERKSEAPTEFRQETAGEIVDRRSIEIKAASCNNSLICDQLIQSRGGKRYQSRVNSQSAAWIKLHSISLSPTPRTPPHSPRTGRGAGCLRSPPAPLPAPRRGAVQPRILRRVPPPPAQPGARLPQLGRGEGLGGRGGCESKQLLLNQSVHGYK